jgi:uncharacterized protein (DUF4415 family)
MLDKAAGVSAEPSQGHKSGFGEGWQTRLNSLLRREVLGET